MNKIWILLAVFVLLFSGAANAKQVKRKDLTTDNDKLNYAVGYDVGRSVARNKLTLKPNIFVKGIVDGIANDDNPDAGLLTDQERIEVKRSYSQKQREREREERLASSGENQKASAAFLKKNKRKKGVITTESGLQYRIVKKGFGPKPTEADRVTVHYRGTQVDGTEFDSSYKRNQPSTFPVNRVVKGWTEALQLMPVGSKWILYIPPELGYGERGAGAKIGPNIVMIFEIELLAIESDEERNEFYRDYKDDADDSAESQEYPPQLSDIVPTGVYKGMGYQNNGSTWSIEIIVDNESATIKYPSLLCGGTLSVKRVLNTRVDFHEDITYGDNCVDNGTTVLSVTDDADTFYFHWEYADGVAGAVGTVRRD